jgi:hypothetical protein
MLRWPPFDAGLKACSALALNDRPAQHLKSWEELESREYGMPARFWWRFREPEMLWQSARRPRKNDGLIPMKSW